MEKSRLSIAAIMPIYNEADCLAENFDKVVNFFESHFLDFEIIVVESGSTDGSDKFLASRAEGNKNVRVIREGSRNGFGSAVRLGLKAATKDLVCVQTIDLPYDLKYLAKAAELLQRVDYVLSYRSTDGRSCKRRLLTFIYDLLVRAIIRVKVKNVNSALKVYKTPILKNLELHSAGWTLDAEVLMKLSNTTLKFERIPVPYTERTSGTSTIVFGTPIKILLDLLKMKLSQMTRRSS